MLVVGKASGVWMRRQRYEINHISAKRGLKVRHQARTCSVDRWDRTGEGGRERRSFVEHKIPFCYLVVSQSGAYSRVLMFIWHIRRTPWKFMFVLSVLLVGPPERYMHIVGALRPRTPLYSSVSS